VAGIAATVLAATAAISWIVAARGPKVSWRHAPSIAVLPLRDASVGSESAYFADGISDALIDRLGTIEGLRVISRTSTSRYRDPTSLVPLRRDLQADVAVRGSVERASERVRLVLELVDTATEKPLWQQTLERAANEVLALENDAVRAIVEQIGAPVPASQQVALRTARAVDPVVYEQYLKGRFYWNKRTDGSLEQAARFYQSAIERDPTYAPARAALADCYNQLGTVMVGAASPTEMRPRAKAEAIAAIQTDDSLAEAHATLGYISHYDWDWATAEREFRRAIDLNPNLALAHAWYANYLASRRRLPEAIDEVRRAEELDPFSLVVVTNVGWTLSYARRPNEAIAAYRRALRLDPTYIQAHSRLAGELSVSGRAEEALTEGRAVVKMTHRSPSSLVALAQIYARAGQRAEAAALLKELMHVARNRYISPTGISQLHFLLNDPDQGFAWMEKAFEERTNGMAYIAVDSYLDPFRTDPRYGRMLVRVGLTDAQ